jgi:monofunctional glycosyltransferase
MKNRLKLTVQRLKRALRSLCWMLLLLALLPIPVMLGLRAFDPPSSAFIALRQWDAWRQNEKSFVLHHRFVPIERISPSLALAVVAAEDQRFPTHFGFDFDAIEQALAKNAGSTRLRGGSTISQQLCKNLFLWPRQSYLRKGLEAYLTLWLELLVPKRRILELYLNVAEFGDGIYGADAAARRLFQRSPDRLSANQAALLAAVLPNPKNYRANAPGPWLNQRARHIERQMRNLGSDWLQSM